MNNQAVDQIIEIQNKWADGIIAIGKLINDQSKCENTAREFIDNFYAYNFTTVLFKPTRASTMQFRGTEIAALSYFIGANSDFPEDTGFALTPWKSVRFENQSYILDYDLKCVMGNYYFTDYDGHTTKAEFTMGFVPNKRGELRINLHHSSFPYTPN